MGRQTVLRLILVAWVSVLNFQVLSATPQSAQDPTGKSRSRHRLGDQRKVGLAFFSDHADQAEANGTTTGAGQIASGSDDSWTQKARKLCASLSLDEKLSQLNTPAAAVPNVKLPAFNWWSGERLHQIFSSKRSHEGWDLLFQASRVVPDDPLLLGQGSHRGERVSLLSRAASFASPLSLAS